MTVDAEILLKDGDLRLSPCPPWKRFWVKFDGAD